MYEHLPQLPSVVSVIHEAGLRHHLWKDALEKIADQISAAAGFLLIYDALKICNLFLAVGEACNEAQKDKKFSYSFPTLSPLVQFEEPESNSSWSFVPCLYSEPLPSHDKDKKKHLSQFEKRNTVISQLHSVDGIKVLVAFHWNNQTEVPYQTRLILDNLSSHFKISTWTLLHTIPHTENYLENCPIIGKLHLPIIIADCDGYVCYQNNLATAIINKNDGLKIIGRKIASASSASLIKEKISQALFEGRPMAILVPRVHDKTPYQLYITPNQSNRNNNIYLRSSAIIHIACIDRDLSHQDFYFCELFSFTPAEAKLASRLAVGLSPGECAKAANVSISTVRTQIRSLITKTQTSRLSNLTILLSSIVQSAPVSHADNFQFRTFS
jgi:DNA-binding CsgD family transcriptional regulator